MVLGKREAQKALTGAHADRYMMQQRRVAKYAYLFLRRHVRAYEGEPTPRLRDFALESANIHPKDGKDDAAIDVQDLSNGLAHVEAALGVARRPGRPQRGNYR